MLDFKREGLLRMVRTADTMATHATPRRRRITKRELAKRDLRFVEKLAAGATIEEIAASEGISMKWARERKAAVLASRVIDTPHEFIKLQIRRLSEAMLVSYSAMSNGDLRAVDKVIKVARELDRYHGFAPRGNAQGYAPSLPAAPPRGSLCRSPRRRSRQWIGMRARLVTTARRETASGAESLQRRSARGREPAWP
jgi:hypothetical protein